MKFTNIDATNRIGTISDMNVIKEADRGAWVLIPAYNKTPHLDQKNKEHQRIMKALSRAHRCLFQ